MALDNPDLTSPAPPPRGSAPELRAATGDDATREGVERVLICAPTGRDSALISQALHHAGFEPFHCGDIVTLCTKIAGGAGAALIAEEAISPEGIDCLRNALKDQPAWSDLPVIIMTSGGKTTQYSEHLVRELEDLTNLTLLERPLRILTFISAVQSSIRARRKQYLVKRLLDQKEDAVRQRDRFLAMLGHELRNPLAAIRTAVEVLGTCSCDGNRNDTLGEHTRIIKRQASNLSRLVDDLLDVARATAGKIVLSRQILDLRALARRAVDDVQLGIGMRRHSVTLDSAPEPVPVFGDPVRLEQVIVNLLTNAIKYTAAGGSIFLRVCRGEPETAELHVRDSGEGIPAQMLPRIFDPFVQVEQNLDRSRGGLGLGLPLVRALVEMHEGSVAALSEGPGKGSEFIVRLPLAASPPPPRGQSPPTAQKPARASRRVLIVEDSNDSRMAMRSLVRLWGHQVAVAEDGPSGVRRAEEFRPDVALVDIGLPGLDGYQVARLIRASLGQDVCLIALTGYGQPEDKERSERAGFDKHLVKPVEPERLAHLINDPSTCRDSSRA